MRYLIAPIIALFLLAGTAQAAPPCYQNFERVAQHFGTYAGQEETPGEPRWNSLYDLNNSGAVAITDIILSYNCWVALRY